MEEPQPLSGSLAHLIRDFPPDHPVRGCADEMTRAEKLCTDRRAAVLKHDDLAARLVKELGYRRARDWNGWIPPELVNEWSDDEILRAPSGRLNQLTRRATGERPNDSPRRAILIEICAEAWKREHELPV